jgi:hypothetical protein
VGAVKSAWQNLPDAPVTLSNVLSWSADNPVGAAFILALVAMVGIMIAAFVETRSARQTATIQLSVGSGTARLGAGGQVRKRSADILVSNGGAPFNLVAHAKLIAVSVGFEWSENDQWEYAPRILKGGAASRTWYHIATVEPNNSTDWIVAVRAEAMIHIRKWEGSRPLVFYVEWTFFNEVAATLHPIESAVVRVALTSNYDAFDVRIESQRQSQLTADEIKEIQTKLSAEERAKMVRQAQIEELAPSPEPETTESPSQPILPPPPINTEPQWPFVGGGTARVIRDTLEKTATDSLAETSFERAARQLDNIVVEWRKTDSHLMVNVTNKNYEVITGFEIWVEEPLRKSGKAYAQQKEFADYQPLRLHGGSNRIFHDQPETFPFLSYTTERLYYSGYSADNPNGQGNFRTLGVWKVTFRTVIDGMPRNHELFFNWDNYRKTIPMPCDEEGNALG